MGKHLVYLVTYIILCLYGIRCSAQVEETVYLYGNQNRDSTEQQEQYRDTVENILKITRIHHPYLKVFRPKKGKENGVGVIVCPGGGYYLLAANLEGYEVAEWLTELGYTAFVLHYRVPNKRKEALEDIKTTIALVRKNHEKYKLNTNKIGALGFSAGGHLAASVSSLKEDVKVLKITGKASSKPDFSILIYPAYLAEEKSAKLSSELQVNDETGPMFLFATADDRHTKGSLVMAESLRQYNVPFEIHVLAKGGHGYGLRKGNKAAETWPRLVLNWLTALFPND